MKNDIIPKRSPASSDDPLWQSPTSNPQTPLSVQQSVPSPDNTTGLNEPESTSPSDGSASTDEHENTPSKGKNGLWRFIGIVVAILLLGVLGCVIWYQLALQPLKSGDVANVRVSIEEGSSPSQIGQLLAEKEIIRDQTAFELYTRIHNVRNKLQAGDFSLSPTESTPVIISHLTSGKTEQYAVTFYPGATLNIASTDADKTPSHRQVLEDAGFGAEEIDEAFAASYDHPLFASKPASADLEGYIYGETYQVATGASAKQILTRTFDEYYAQIEKNNLLDGFEEQGLTLHEAIILGSIIQREVPSKTDQKQVAQIFLKRYNEGEKLGSDVTYHYAADKRGVPRDNNLNDPYNTRKYAGLPPGPIASPGISALQAVADPAEGDYIFFISGDDDKTYYARTNAEHEANVAKYCSFKCSLP